MQPELGTHEPPEQLPLLHAVPSGAAAQLPDEQDAHSPHAAHASPFAPHAVAVVPLRQVDPSQHPVQHVAPWHSPPVHALPSTDGTHAPEEHVSHARQSALDAHGARAQAPASQRSPSGQPPHEPPHESSPHARPVQSGTQHAPLTHTPRSQSAPSASGWQAPLAHRSQPPQSASTSQATGASVPASLPASPGASAGESIEAASSGGWDW